MSKAIKYEIADLKFQESKRMLLVAVMTNMILYVLLCMGNDTGPLDYRPMICLVSAFSIAIGIWKYNWTNQRMNIGFLIYYLTLVLVEIYILGVPDTPLHLGGRHSKGMLLDMIIVVLPLFYLGLRIISITPSFEVMMKYRKMNSFRK